MSYRYINMVFLFLLAFNIEAQDLCSNTYKYSCGPESKYDTMEDGTGNSYDPKTKQNIKTISDNIRKDFKKELLAYLDQNPNSAKRVYGQFPCNNECKLKSQKYVDMNVDNLLFVGTSLPIPSERGSFNYLYEYQDRLLAGFSKPLGTLKNLSDDTNVKFMAQVVPYYKRNHIQKTLFPQIKNAAMKIVDQLPNSPEKVEIKKRISELSLKTELCHKDLTRADGYIDPEKKEVTYCLNNLMRANSIYPQIFTIAHEIAHTFHPCKNRKPVQNYPFASVFKCLDLNQQDSDDILKQSCHKHTNEKFCDWFAGQILSAMLTNYYPESRPPTQVQIKNGVVNSMRVFCEAENNGAGEHPSVEQRMETLISNRELRRQMGCVKPPPQKTCEALEFAPQLKSVEKTSTEK